MHNWTTNGHTITQNYTKHFQTFWKGTPLSPSPGLYFTLAPLMQNPWKQTPTWWPCLGAPGIWKLGISGNLHGKHFEQEFSLTVFRDGGGGGDKLPLGIPLPLDRLSSQLLKSQFTPPPLPAPLQLKKVTFRSCALTHHPRHLPTVCAFIPLLLHNPCFNRILGAGYYQFNVNCYWH